MQYMILLYYDVQVADTARFSKLHAPCHISEHEPDACPMWQSQHCQVAQQSTESGSPQRSDMAQ